MLHRISLTHRILLIYLLRLVAVVVLAYSLIVEKNIAITFAQKEQRGSSYIAVVRDALLAVIEDHLTASSPETATTLRHAALEDYAAKILAAQTQYGGEMHTQQLAHDVSLTLRQLSEDDG